MYLDWPGRSWSSIFKWLSLVSLIAWHELLSLLEGPPCKLSRCKIVFATDLSIPRLNSIPFFATGIKSIKYVGASGQRNERETYMMDNRWEIFEFTHQIPKNESLGIEICPNIFRFGNVRWRLTVKFELMRWLSFVLLWTLEIYRFPFCFICKYF